MKKFLQLLKLLKYRDYIVSFHLKPLFLSPAGFTILELLAVLTIIGILAGVIISRVPFFTQMAKDSQREADLRKIDLALEEYYSDKHGYPGTPGEYSYSSLPSGFINELLDEDYLTSQIDDPDPSVRTYKYYLSRNGDNNNKSRDGSDFALCASLERETSGENIYSKDGAYYYLTCSSDTFCEWFWSYNGCISLELPTCAEDGDGVTGVCCDISINECSDFKGSVSDCSGGAICCGSGSCERLCSSYTDGGETAQCCSYECLGENYGSTPDCGADQTCCLGDCKPSCTDDHGGECCPLTHTCNIPIEGESDCGEDSQCCTTEECELPECGDLGGECCLDQTGYTCENGVELEGRCDGGEKCCETKCIRPCNVEGGSCCPPAGLCVALIEGNCDPGEKCCQICTIPCQGECCSTETCQGAAEGNCPEVGEKCCTGCGDTCQGECCPDQVGYECQQSATGSCAEGTCCATGYCIGPCEGICCLEGTCSSTQEGTCGSGEVCCTTSCRQIYTCEKNGYTCCAGLCAGSHSEFTCPSGQTCCEICLLSP